MSQQARKFLGVQEISVGSSQSVSIKPQSNGVPDGQWHCDMVIQNTGSTVVWIRPDSSQATSGIKLPADGDFVSFNSHKSEDGDIYVYFDDAGGGEVNASFLE